MDDLRATMSAKRSIPCEGSSVGTPVVSRGVGQTRELTVAEATSSLLSVRSRLEREFRELFEAGADLPGGVKEQIEAASDRIAQYLQRLGDEDRIALEELRLLSHASEFLAESVSEAFLLDASIAPEFRGPGVLEHMKRHTSPAVRRLIRIRGRAEELLAETMAGEEAEAIEHVMRVSIGLAKARLEYLLKRYEEQPELLRMEIQRRLRSGKNPLRILAEEMNSIVKETVLCLRES
jgi:hypothetical protein